MASKQKLRRRSRLARGRGRRFEDQVVIRLHSLGYARVKKKVLSGATLKVPYDVLVSPFKLKLEAKRTFGGFIPVQRKWLDRLKPMFSLVFAVGTFRGRQKVLMYAISLIQNEILSDEQQALEMIEITKGSKRIQEETLEKNFIIHCNERNFLVEPFEAYLKKEVPLNES